MSAWVYSWQRGWEALEEFSEEISTKARGLIGTDSLILKRASQHFKAFLVMCLVVKIIMCPFFHREIFFISAGSPGLSRSARTFGYVSISLSVPVSVIQVSACAPHSPLCTPAHPSGALLYVLRRGHDVCVCCTTSDTRRLQCCYHMCFESDLCTIQSMSCIH